MKEAKPRIAIVNSSSFGKRYPEHIQQLKKFADICEVNVPANSSPSTLIEKLAGVDGIIASVTPRFTAETLKGLPKLVLLSRHGIGCDNVDLKCATTLGIMVSRVQGEVERNAVAEYAISLLMAASRFIPQGSQAVINSEWAVRSKFVGLEITGKIIGVIGMGNIGSRTTEILGKGFRSNVIVYDPYLSAEKIAEGGGRKVELDILLGSSDAILFHCPLTEETSRLLSKSRIGQLKRGCIIVNTCRGELIDEDALVQALHSGQIGSYATDVVEGEPIDGNHRLCKAENVIITPHLGGYTSESLFGMGQTCVDDCLAVFTSSGIAKELANPEVLARERRIWG